MDAERLKEIEDALTALPWDNPLPWMLSETVAELLKLSALARRMREAQRDLDTWLNDPYDHPDYNKTKQLEAEFDALIGMEKDNGRR